MTSRRTFLVSSLAALGAAACGGHGSSSTCSYQPIYPTYHYIVNGSDVGMKISATRGVAITATFYVTNIPSNCQSQLGFSLKNGYTLPAGLSIDSSTGNISGTPTVTVTKDVVVIMEIPGYSNEEFTVRLDVSNPV